jgi:hypothetical protein
MIMVREGGLEPLGLAAPDPKSNGIIGNARRTMAHRSIFEAFRFNGPRAGSRQHLARISATTPPHSDHGPHRGGVLPLEIAR